MLHLVTSFICNAIIISTYKLRELLVHRTHFFIFKIQEIVLIKV